MSMHSDENALVPTSDSFWEPGNYKRTTKRTEDGNKLCDDLMKLVQERAEIEKSYAKSLKSWSKKWNDLIEKGTFLAQSTVTVISSFFVASYFFISFVSCPIIK